MSTTTTTEHQPGDQVRYHGTLTEYHGQWRVRGTIEHGPYTGRVCLDTPRLDIDPPETAPSELQTLIVSAGNTSITPLDCEVCRPARKPGEPCLCPPF